MTTINIYFQDLKESTQTQLWQAVQHELLAGGSVESRCENETEEAFQARLQEAIDHHINTHNVAHEFCL